MKLETLIINRCSYGPNEGKYQGSCKFAGQYGTVDIVLAPDVSEEVLRLCAGALVRNSREVAHNITAQVLEHSGLTALENKE